MHVEVLEGLGAVFVNDDLLKENGEGGGAGSVVEVSGDLKRVGDTCGAVVHEVQDYCFEVWGLGDVAEDAAEVVAGGAAELEGEGHGREDGEDGDLRDAVEGDGGGGGGDGGDVFGGGVAGEGGGGGGGVLVGGWG